MKNPYEDMLKLPRPVSSAYPKMPIIDRAAQFSPFAALTGHGDAIREKARLTERRRKLGEDTQAFLEEKLAMLANATTDHPLATITYFLEDEKKEGGKYVVAAGAIKKIDEYERIIVFMDGTRIPIRDILEIEGELFEGMD